jgi:hypothetical protein
LNAIHHVYSQNAREILARSLALVLPLAGLPACACGFVIKLSAPAWK